ncbi:hypothetical protein JTE90_026817 [Oedothorax gibbosus]|uniref:MATH domain-containing protein n=1 Tax=Oedothorax gibbosus TaxID=931172 RepID=A0AAV6V5N3_9ARAC|nr:hypothetical protein JTE90_026817 [Oedothorax gibbosus]
MAAQAPTTTNMSSFKCGGRRHLFTYNWTIENLVFWAKKSDEYLETDVFRPRLIDDGIWRLRLYPRGRDETLLWYLERVYGERTETVYANFKITMSTGRVVHYEYHSNNYPFKRGSGAASATEKKLKDILSEGSLTTDPEPLTIVCQMSRRCSSVALAERLSSSTRIEIGRLTFSWHFGQFSKWDPTEEHTHAGYTYGNAVYDILSCKMHLYTNRDPEAERLGIIIRFRRPSTEDFLVVAKISVLDVYGKAVITYNETYFEKAGDDTIVWVTPAFIEKKVLTDAAEVYLPNDELTLLSEFKIPVKNIYAVRLQYSLASNAALQNIVEKTSVAEVPRSSVGTQTVLDTNHTENGTQTELELQKTEIELQTTEEEHCSSNKEPQIFVLSRERGQVVVQAIEKSALSNFKMGKNLVCCKEEDIEFSFDSDDIKEGLSEDECVVYYPEDGTVEYCLNYLLTEDSDDNREFIVVDYSEEDNDKNLDDQTQKIENAIQSGLAEEYYEEGLVTITEDEEDSQNVSGSNENEDSDDDVTSEEGSEESSGASMTKDDCSDDTSTSGNVRDYYDKAANTKRRTKSRCTSQESAASDVMEFFEEEMLKRAKLTEELNGSYSKAFKGCVTVYIVAMFLYFYINDAITYAKKNSISPPFGKHDEIISEFVKQLTILYAETLDDQSTLEFVLGYTSHSNFPISNLSTENAWVILALADAHQDEKLIKMVIDFLDANKATTLDSLEWRNEVGSRILKAHAVFRQRFSTKPTIEQQKV